MAILEDIEGYTSYELAGMAGCTAPDSLSSPGARMLDSVRDGVVELIKRGEITFDDFDDNGQLHEVADSGPSDYTHTLWREFVDLCAYLEEPEFDTDWGTDLNRAAAMALYQICSRLTYALASEWRDGWECPVCTNPRRDYDCAPEDCRGWQCPECNGYDNTHGCLIDQCKAPVSAGEPLPIRTPGAALHTCQHCGQAIVPDEDNGWMHSDGIVGCGTPDAEQLEIYATPAVGEPVSDVLTGPVDLPPVSDPLLSLIEAAEAEEMGRRVGKRARLAAAAVSRFRWRVWTTTAVLAVVSVAVILGKGGVW